MDTAVVTVLLLLLALWVGYAQLGERGRIARCAGNLHALSKAMHHYAADHDGMLPPAGVNVGKYQSSWDLEIVPYLKPGLAKANNEQLLQTVPRFFACPSDTLGRSGTKRSYAMSRHDMTARNWPPGPDTTTGVGLNWDSLSVQRLLGDEAAKKPESLPGLKLSAIPAPADTVLLTEMVAPDNVMGKAQWAAISGTVQQKQSFPDGGAAFHRGRFNYLMVDGHVEWLSPLQSGAFDGTAGIWTLKSGD